MSNYDQDSAMEEFQDVATVPRGEFTNEEEIKLGRFDRLENELEEMTMRYYNERGDHEETKKELEATINENVRLKQMCKYVGIN